MNYYVWKVEFLLGKTAIISRIRRNRSRADDEENVLMRKIKISRGNFYTMRRKFRRVWSNATNMETFSHKITIFLLQPVSEPTKNFQTTTLVFLCRPLCALFRLFYIYLLFFPTFFPSSFGLFHAPDEALWNKMYVKIAVLSGCILPIRATFPKILFVMADIREIVWEITSWKKKSKY